MSMFLDESAVDICNRARAGSNSWRARRILRALMTSVHAVTGFVTAAWIAAVVVWALAAKLLHRSPGRSFERAALGAAGLLAMQVLFGVVLLASGRHRSGLHYVYGI